MMQDDVCKHCGNAIEKEANQIWWRTFYGAKTISCPKNPVIDAHEPRSPFYDA